MTAKVFALSTKAGIQRDGTVFDAQFYSDGRWVRFQRGRPRKIGGYSVISNQLTGPSRGVWVNPSDAFTAVFSGYNNGLQSLSIDNNGVGAGVTDYTLSNFTASDLNLWQFDGFYDVGGAGVATILAHPGQNLESIDNTTNTPVLSGNINGTTLSQIGTFSAAGTANGTTTITLGASNPLIGAGQTVTGTYIPSGATVVSISTTTLVISAAATGSGATTLTFNNSVSVSGGVVSLHPYVFVYGNNGLIKNCSAGNLQDWVSADANEVNVATGKIVQGLPVRGGSNAPSGLFWSLDSLIRVSFIGGTGTPPQYWRYDIITSQSSILSSQSAIEYDGIYYWCGVDRFLLYNGVVKEIQNDMNQNYFFDNLNYNQRQKVWACKVPRFGEVWWFYPKGDATECTDAIIYNVRENIWYDAGEALGARRSAGYFSQVFAHPVMANWETSTSNFIFSGSYDLITGNSQLGLSTANTQVAVGQAVSGVGVPSGTIVTAVRTNGVNGNYISFTGGVPTDGTYTNVNFYKTGSEVPPNCAQATVVVAGGVFVSVTFTNYGASYSVGDVLFTVGAPFITESNVQVTITSVWAQVIVFSNAFTSTSTETLTFSTRAGLIQMLQHEVGTDAIDGQNVNAIESYFETCDLGLVSGGPSQPNMVGDNKWLRLERVEPDFVMSGTMSLYITGRPFAQSDDAVSQPYVFDANTNKIDMKEQRRELRLKFVSNVAGGNYQTGKILLNADTGDVRGY